MTNGRIRFSAEARRQRRPGTPGMAISGMAIAGMLGLLSAFVPIQTSAQPANQTPPQSNTPPLGTADALTAPGAT